VRSIRGSLPITGSTREFNSLDAQYDAASAYIKSQAHAGWTLIRSRYDDGGYSGGSTDRPDLQKLLDDIRARKIDVIVVYKVDRLTRSLADFAKLVELFDSHGVSFVSVTQQFNTTTSMGRLTLNVLLSFAQFEREVTSERIRDKIAASKRKGLWVGGTLPLGYEMKDGKIAIVEEEAELVRSIFRRYLELGGVNELLRDLRERNIRTKTRLLSTGATRGGIPFGRGALYYLLSNHFYIGEVKYKNEILPGEQPPIMNRGLFEAVRQKSLAQWSHCTVVRNKFDQLLTGLLFDDAGHRMIPTHATKAGTFCESAESSRGRRVPSVWRGGPAGTTLERGLPPLAHAASPVLSVAAAPALRPQPLRSSGTEGPQPDFRQGRFVRAVTRSMCWQKFDPPLDPRTHLAIRFGSRNSHSMTNKRRPSSSQVTCGAKPLTNPRPRPWQGITHATNQRTPTPNGVRAIADVAAPSHAVMTRLHKVAEPSATARRIGRAGYLWCQRA
jgi:DNA invertase Pin-like site-specific DNA recombinase